MDFELSDEDNKLSSLNTIENCVSEVRMWMNANFLKVNEDKTVGLVHASRKNQMKHNITAIKIGDYDIIPGPSARNIGVVFDVEMSMASHVHQTCRVCYYHDSQEYRFYPVMPDRASHNSYRAFSGAFEVGLRKRSSVRYSRRSHRQTTESAALCCPIG